MKRVTVGERTAILDVEPITPEQGALLAEALAKMLIKTGSLANGALLTGPHLLQFTEEWLEHG